VRKISQIWQGLIQRFRWRAKPAGLESGRTTASSDEHAELLANMAGLQSELAHFRQQDEQQLDELRLRVGEIESERDTRLQQLEVLRGELEEAVARQDKAEIHANNLEIRLREQAEEHHAAQQRALIRERRQARRLNVTMTVAVMAFMLAFVLSVETFREAQNNTRLMAGIHQGIQDIRDTIRNFQTSEHHAAAPATGSTEQQPPSAAEAPGQIPADKAGSEQSGPVLPEPDFVAIGSLPLSGNNFSSRRDASTFFQENARQPGVVALPSGLQYREIIPGSGGTPGPADTVVIEYRAFRPDGTELDNSFRETQPSTFIVAEAIPGLREALQLMQEGGQWELYVPPALVSNGVRKRGRFGFEPLIYVVELLSIAAEGTTDQEE
jgi:hypothetical protein